MQLNPIAMIICHYLFGSHSRCFCAMLQKHDWCVGCGQRLNELTVKPPMLSKVNGPKETAMLWRICSAKPISKRIDMHNTFVFQFLVRMLTCLDLWKLLTIQLAPYTCIGRIRESAEDLGLQEAAGGTYRYWRMVQRGWDENRSQVGVARFWVCRPCHIYMMYNNYIMMWQACEKKTSNI